MVPMKSETYSLKSELLDENSNFRYILAVYFLLCYILAMPMDRDVHSFNM